MRNDLQSRETQNRYGKPRAARRDHSASALSAVLERAPQRAVGMATPAAARATAPGEPATLEIPNQACRRRALTSTPSRSA